MKLLTTVLNRFKIAEFIGTIEGQFAFENAQRDIITLYPQISYLENNAVNSTGVLTDTDLKIAIEKGKIYIVEAFLTFQSNALNHGVAIALKIPTGAEVSGMFNHNHTLFETQGGAQTANSAVTDHTKDVYVANANIPLYGRWLVKANNATGDVVLQIQSESATATMTLIGGLCVLRAMQVV